MVHILTEYVILVRIFTGTKSVTTRVATSQAHPRGTTDNAFLEQWVVVLSEALVTGP